MRLILSPRLTRLVGAALRRLAFGRVEKVNDILDRPKPPRNISRHRGRNP
jgi:hypothetical protein